MAKIKIELDDDEIQELKDLIDDWVNRVEEAVEKIEEEKKDTGAAS